MSFASSKAEPEKENTHTGDQKPAGKKAEATISLPESTTI